jgi:adenylate cyclase
MDVLVHLLTHHDCVVSADEILSRVWPRRCGDPGMVKKRVAQIRRALDDEARHPLYIETISKRGYRTVATVTRLASGDGAERALAPLQSTAIEASIVVLPFANLSGDPKDEYFSDGVAEELRHVLSKIPRLQVAGRTSSLSSKAMNTDVRHLAHALRVNHVLEGSVRRDGDRVRVRLQLIDAVRGFGTWSQSFDRALGDIFALQDEIAVAVAGALRVKLAGPPDGATTQSFDAYNALLKGRAMMNYADPGELRGAIRCFEHAISLDRDYGSAHGALALSHALLSVYTPIAEIAVEWESAFSRALSINPEDANALAAKAAYVTVTQWDWRQAGDLYERAINIGLSSDAAKLYGTMFLAALGTWDELRSFYSDVLKTDPFNTDILWDLATFAAGFGEPELSLRTWDRLLATTVDSGLITAAWSGRALAHAMLGDHAVARAALAKVAPDDGVPIVWQYYLWAILLMKDRRNLRRQLDKLRTRAERDHAYRVPLALVYATIGDTDKAVASYECLLPIYPWAVMYLRAPNHAQLAGPRFEELLRRVHLDDAYLNAAGLQ